MLKHILRQLDESGPVHVVWTFYIGIGAFLFGVFSYPSDGPRNALIVLFGLAGLLTLSGSLLYTKHTNYRLSTNLVRYGLFVMMVAAWFRGVTLYGLDQEGAGSSILASLVWSWISVGQAMVLATVQTKGLKS